MLCRTESSVISSAVLRSSQEEAEEEEEEEASIGMTGISLPFPAWSCTVSHNTSLVTHS